MTSTLQKSSLSQEWPPGCPAASSQGVWALVVVAVVPWVRVHHCLEAGVELGVVNKSLGSLLPVQPGMGTPSYFPQA